MMKSLTFYLFIFGLVDSIFTQIEFPGDNDEDLKAAFEVTRLDTQRSTCISHFGRRFLVPNYDLDALEVPNGGISWNWTSEWQMTNLNHYDLQVERYMKRRHFVFSDGGNNLQLLFDFHSEFGVLASNASLWINEKDRPSNGFMMLIDHWNKTARVKFTQVMSCGKRPLDNKQAEENCSTLVFKNDTNLLNDGRDWADFQFVAGSANMSFLKWFPRNESIEFRVNWNIPFNDDWRRYSAFARSHQRPGVFSHPWLHPIAPTADENQMSKNFSQPRAGKFCVVVEMDRIPERFNYELLNLNNNQVETLGHTHDIAGDDSLLRQLKFDYLPAGKYQLTFKNIPWSITMSNIEQCPWDMVGGKVFEKTQEPPIAPSHCSLVTKRNVASKSFLTLKSNISNGHANATLTTSWNADEWAYVCEQLGVAQNMSGLVVNIKICNPIWGCNFAHCPYNTSRRQEISSPKIAQNTGV